MAVWRRLEEHDWSGAVRGLENVIERALILSPGGELVLPQVGNPEMRAVSGASVPSAAADASGASVPSFDEAMRDLLRRVPDAAEGRIYGPGGAADLLHLKPATLQEKLRKYGLREG